jgi:hypothetical protein
MKMSGCASKRRVNRLPNLTAWRKPLRIIELSIYDHVASARLRLAIFVLD